MKRVIIICEGETEQEFYSTILYRYFLGKNIQFICQLIKKSRGGIVNWGQLKRQIEISLKQDTSVYVTTMIDYYGINKKHNFPNWDKVQQIGDKYSRMNYLEKSMQEDINSSLNYRFIPYVQLHEFEGLLFIKEEYFYNVIPKEELTGIDELKQIFLEFDNPEMINDNPETAPSKRLARIIKGYNKIVYGNILADEIGLENIRMKSPRFNGWLNKIEKTVNK